MSSYKFILEQYKGPSTRYRCPSCNQPRQFARYIDTETGEVLAEDVGMCNRVNKCGYHYTPKQFFADNPNISNAQVKQYRQPTFKPAKPPQTVQYLPVDLVQRTCTNYHKNNLHKAFIMWFNVDVANDVFKRYRVGTSSKWGGATAFWQIDNKGNARQCKIMLYNPETGKRIKEPSDMVYFAGKAILKDYNANLQQCFFGEHLLEDKVKPVAIVESEKTAMYCSVIYPGLIWIATGGKQGCRFTEKDVCKALEGRTVVLFPDLKATGLWKEKAAEISAKIKCRIHVSEDLEAMASEAQKESGLDIMDYLIIERQAPNVEVDLKQQFKDEVLNEAKHKEVVQCDEIYNKYESKGLQPGEALEVANELMNEYGIKEIEPQPQKITLYDTIKNDDPAIEELEKQLLPLKRLPGPVKIDCCATVHDLGKFIEQHLTIVKQYGISHKAGQPYYNRLQQLICKQQINTG